MIAGFVEMSSANSRSVVRVAPAGLALLEEKRPYSYEWRRGKEG
jgi:hypothetical protein